MLTVTLAVASLLATEAAVAPTQAQFFDPYSVSPPRKATRKEVRRSRTPVTEVSRQRTPADRREPAVRRAAPAIAATRPTADKPTTVKAETGLRPPEPLVAVISLQRQRMMVYGPQGVVAETKVSTGQAGHRTPTGVFSVIQRNRYHHSNIYSGAPMPFMQRITWSGIALHQGVVPGYPASHGCIRLPGDFASRMWGLGRIGMRVLIAPDDVPPISITHARLPAPVMTRVEGTALLTASPIQTASIGTPATDANPSPLSPFALAHLRRARAAADLKKAEQDVKAAQEAMHERSAEANRASDDLRKAERAVTAAEDILAQAQTALAKVADAAPDSEPATAVKQATARLEQAKAEHATVKATEAQKSDAAFDAAKALRAAQERATEATEASRMAGFALEPVSIFVSRKEGKVFVRQGFNPIHEEPITFADPERPLGTHVFTAIDSSDGGAALRWQAVTLPSSPPAAAEPERARRRGAQAPVTPPAPVLPPSKAAEALDRFELPPETMKLVGDRLWSGATLIVSDYGISNETGRGTDFIVLTK